LFRFRIHAVSTASGNHERNVRCTRKFEISSSRTCGRRILCNVSLNITPRRRSTSAGTRGWSEQSLYVGVRLKFTFRGPIGYAVQRTIVRHFRPLDRVYVITLLSSHCSGLVRNRSAFSSARRLPARTSLTVVVPRQRFPTGPLHHRPRCTLYNTRYRRVIAVTVVVTVVRLTLFPRRPTRVRTFDGVPTDRTNVEPVRLVVFGRDVKRTRLNVRKRGRTETFVDCLDIYRLRAPVRYYAPFARARKMKTRRTFETSANRPSSSSKPRLFQFHGARIIRTV